MLELVILLQNNLISKIRENNIDIYASLRKQPPLHAHSVKRWLFSQATYMLACRYYRHSTIIIACTVVYIQYLMHRIIILQQYYACSTYMCSAMHVSTYSAIYACMQQIQYSAIHVVYIIHKLNYAMYQNNSCNNYNKDTLPPLSFLQSIGYFIMIFWSIIYLSICTKVLIIQKCCCGYRKLTVNKIQGLQYLNQALEQFLAIIQQADQCLVKMFRNDYQCFAWSHLHACTCDKTETDFLKLHLCH